MFAKCRLYQGPQVYQIYRSAWIQVTRNLSIADFATENTKFFHWLQFDIYFWVGYYTVFPFGLAPVANRHYATLKAKWEQILKKITIFKKNLQFFFLICVIRFENKSLSYKLLYKNKHTACHVKFLWCNPQHLKTEEKTYKLKDKNFLIYDFLFLIDN